ncbi:MAG: DUF2326 domain-containing protein [Bullifex sp.]|nr:DUF2326 domain-containing protein [Bullifex sp.]
MLEEIRCDKFMEKGSPRPPILFTPGLNTIIGEDNGGNSIGKSTFLMIIDFVFGGNDYTKVLTVVKDNVGDHTIKFRFSFKGVSYRFSRSVIDFNTVLKCDENYNPTGEIYKIDEYRAFLLRSYGIDKSYGTFRDIIGRFFRIYNRNCMDEKRPLSIANETADASVSSFMALLGLKESLAPYEKADREAKEEYDYLNQARKRGDKPVAGTKKQIDELNRKLNNIKEEIKGIDEGLLSSDGIKLEGLSQLGGRLGKLTYQRSKINSRLSNLESEDEYSLAFPADFDDLLYFFPDADTRKLDEVETFHRSINRILAEQIREERDQLQRQLEIINSEIRKVKQECAEFQGNLKITTVESAAKMNRSKELIDERKSIEELISNTEKYQSAKKNKEEYESQLKERRKSLSDDLIRAINQNMKAMNNMITAPNPTTPPEISLTDNGKNYLFTTPKDQGKGSQYKGMVIFDLTMLKMTVLPAIVHDSDLLQPVANNPVDGIVRQYMMSDKQIFVAVDKLHVHSKETQEIFRSRKVLELYPGGGELFGRAWNKPEENTEE